MAPLEIPPGPHETGSVFSVLLKAPTLAMALDTEQIWLMHEAELAPRVHKARPAAALVEAARAAGAKGIAIGTCGNAGVALAFAAKGTGLAVEAHVPARYANAAAVARMSELGARVRRTPGGYEEAVESAAADARRSGLYDANPGGPAGAIYLASYATVAREIAASMGDRELDSVWVPVGNGTTYAGIGQGFLADGRKRPRMGAAGSTGNTAAVRSILEGRVVELDPGTMHETPENEPLLNRRSAHAAEALEVARATDGIACELSDAELVAAAALIAEHTGQQVTPAGAAGLAGLKRALASGALIRRHHVLVLTATSGPPVYR